MRWLCWAACALALGCVSPPFGAADLAAGPPRGEVPFVLRLVSGVPAEYRWLAARVTVDHGPALASDFGRRVAEHQALELVRTALPAGDHEVAVEVELMGGGDWRTFSGLGVRVAPSRLAVAAVHPFELRSGEPTSIDVIVEARGGEAEAGELRLRFEPSPPP